MSFLDSEPCDIHERKSRAYVSRLEIGSGDGYGYGGGVILTIGRFSVQLGEHPDAYGLALEIQRRWNDQSQDKEPTP